MDKQTTKIWKTVATLNNYDAAAVLKSKLVEDYGPQTLIKIKRGYPDLYRIKVWEPPLEKDKKPLLKKTTFKKGQEASKKC